MTVLPEEFQRIMQKKLGTAFPHFMATFQSPPPVSIRLNPRKRSGTASGGPVLWSDCGRYLPTRPSFTFDPFFHAGAYYVQEASSMFLEQAFKQAVALDQPINVLDLSAAPGGKSTHILGLINDQSLLVSNEVIRSRALILKENIQKWGHPNVLVTNNDPRDFEPLRGFFDVLVVDAPCSGEGLFRKDPDAVQEWSPQHVTFCSSRQKRMLSDAWPALKENGILIYCTCTYNESENEDNLHWLNSLHLADFVKLKLEPHWGVEEVTKDNVTGYRFFPHKLSGEGFFIAVMRKRESVNTIRTKMKEKPLAPAKKISEAVRSWVLHPEKQKFLQHNDRVYFVPETVSIPIEFLLRHLKTVDAGTGLATVKHDKLIPAHPAALSVELNKEHFNQISLNRDDAVRYLRKDSLTLEKYERGHALVLYEDIALGWVNVLDNRVNSLYPSEWRIRMVPPAGIADGGHMLRN